MASFKEIERSHWQYYLELEQEMILTRRYVDFQKENFSTYSVEFLKLLQAVCGEIDTFGKIIASDISHDFQADNKTNIIKWWFEVQSWYNELNNKTVLFCKEFELSPWASFEVEKRADKNGKMKCYLKKDNGIHIPFWWNAYNSVKHNRTKIDNFGKTNYMKANLKNTCNAFAALYILEKNYLQQLGKEEENAALGKSIMFETEHYPYRDGQALVIW